MAMNAKQDLNTIPNQLIAQRAYDLWEAEGRPEGRDVDHWIRAEAMLRSESSASIEAKTEVNTPSTTKSSRRATPPRSSARREKNVEVVL
jgi:hypothetical protein